MRERSTKQGMKDVASGWAPELEGVAVDLQKQLGWNRSVGSHHDHLWKMSSKERMLDHWVTVLGALGINEPKANAVLQRVEVAIADTLPGVWRVFTEEAHEANAGMTKRDERHQQMRQMMAVLTAAGRPATRSKER